MNNIKIYIPHYSKLIERKPLIAKELAAAGINQFTFYEKFDKECITEEEFSNDASLIRTKISNFIPEQVINNFLRDGLTQGEKSLSLKHKNIYKEFLETSKEEDILLILEDDARLARGFKNIIETLVSKAKFSCINLSAGANKEIVPLTNDKLERLSLTEVKHHPFNTGTEGYMMSYSCVSKVYDIICKKKLCLPIDWELSYVFMSSNLECHRVIPCLTYQASMTGQFVSSIRDRGTDY